MDAEARTIIRCPSCGQRLRLPITTATLAVKCQKCTRQFQYPFEPPESSHAGLRRPRPFASFRQWVGLPFALLVFISLVWFLSRENPVERQPVPPAPAPVRWLSVSYGHLVDHSIITHSGQTVGEVLQQLRARDHDQFRGFLQSYLEPHSVLCNEQLPAPASAGAPPLRNILEHYPPGSARPAWADIAREGHFQVYYNSDLMRLFLKDNDPRAAFERFRSVVRHPIRDIMHSEGLSVGRIEVYAFTNDYARTEIRLNAIPRVFSLNELNLSARAKSLDLDSIEALLDQGVAMEAAEVDRHNDIFFYGRRVPGATLAGRPLGLSDLTLSTGFDPNTGRQLKAEIAKSVPGFLLQDERGFLAPSASEGTLQIRYWFYPDNIGTVTDGSMGVVQSYQFFADAERMDVEIRLDQAIRDTIDHLNANYSHYEAALPVYRELGHLGRLFALILWLQETNAGGRVELDDLLSVMLPAFWPRNTIVEAIRLGHSQTVDCFSTCDQTRNSPQATEYLLYVLPIDKSVKRGLVFPGQCCTHFGFKVFDIR